MLFYLILFIVLIVASSSSRAKPRPPRRSTEESERELVAKLQRIAAECEDGSVKIIEPEHEVRQAKIAWSEPQVPARLYFLEYRDARGEITSRYVRLHRLGKRVDGFEMIEAYDGSRLKTFRKDRIVSMREVQ